MRKRCHSWFNQWTSYRLNTQCLPLSSVMGLSYIETLVAMSIMAIIGTSFIGIYPELLAAIKPTQNRYTLITAMSYVSDYVYQWSNDPTKSPSFESYTDNSQLMPAGNFQVNSIPFGDPSSSFSNTIKTSITFHETNRINRAIVSIIVWNDVNNDNILNSPNERHLTMATVISEKN